MNDNERRTMKAHGITRTTRNVYHYKHYKYDRLDDAVRYAEIDMRRDAAAADAADTGAGE